MKTNSVVPGTLVLCLALVGGCVTTTTKSGDMVGQASSQPTPNMTTRSEGINTGGQLIIGHRVIESVAGVSEVEFTTAKSVPGGKTVLAFVPNSILAGITPVAKIFWHGDDPKKKFKKDPSRIMNVAWRLFDDLDLIMVIRPHSGSKYNWRQLSEVQLHIALVEYIVQAFQVQKFNLYGHSGGGLIAIAIAKERPDLTATVGLASPKLAVREHYLRHEGGVPSRYRGQYDPLRHIDKLSPEIPVMVVYDDEGDRDVKPGGVLPYLNKARELGLKVRWFRSRAGHYTTQHLGWALRKPENKDFWPR